MQIKDVLRTGAITCTADLSLEEVAELMKANDVGSVVVVDDNQSPIGMVTDRDIVVRGVAEGLDLDAPVESVMSESVECLSENADPLAIIRRMGIEGIRRLPVVDASGRVVGVVSLGDALKLIVDSMNRLVDGIAPEAPKIPAAA